MLLEYGTYDHIHTAVVHLSTKFGGNIFAQSGDNGHSSKFNVAVAAILDFHDK